ncbi:MAG TPA: iron ABC transporter permease [Chryseosolibacter sp.]
MQLNSAFRWGILVGSLGLLFVLNLTLGSVKIPASEILNILLGFRSEEPVWTEIIWDFRMTKAFTCVLGGSALALGGLQMQTLFRNPLAGPDVLGLTSGASLAVSLLYMGSAAGVTVLFISSAWAVAIASSIGCLGVFLIMLAVSKRLKDNVSLLIVGLMVGAATASVVSVLQYLSRAEDLQVYMIWTFGSLSGLNWVEIRVLAAIVLAGLVISVLNVKALNVWLLGENYAQSLGINIKRSRLLAIFSASILTGGVTAFCGPIAFVGLAVPHLVKLLINSHNHKLLLPAVAVGGAVLLLACDILAQLPSSSAVLPINAITALVGAPVVIWVIMRNKIIR